MDPLMDALKLLSTLRASGVTRPYHVSLPLDLPVDIMWHAPSVTVRFSRGVLMYACEIFRERMMMRVRPARDWACAARQIVALHRALEALQREDNPQLLEDFIKGDAVCWAAFQPQKNFVGLLNWHTGKLQTSQ
jgi:hypothetical protein